MIPSVVAKLRDDHLIDLISSNFHWSFVIKFSVTNQADIAVVGRDSASSETRREDIPSGWEFLYDSTWISHQLFFFGFKADYFKPGIL
jgi:hypothetical protein